MDGHTRAFAAFLHGLSKVTVYWERDKLDWEAYKICVEWCKEEEVYTIADLINRVLPQHQYDILWLKRCERMQQDLQEKRKKHMRLQ